MDKERRERIFKRLNFLYQDEKTAENMIKEMEERFEKYRRKKPDKIWVDEKDTILITYGDSIQKENQPHLRTLLEFMKKYVGDVIVSIHILPMFPYTSDDGFSVVDYRQINTELGQWEDIENLGKNYSLMFDAVINHISKSSQWFQGFLNGEEPYKHYFITADKDMDYSSVTRPRALPLLTPFETGEGTKYLWTTFSEDQIDLNYRCPELFMEILDLLLFYAKKGARFIRLDAIGFLWKEPGTSCMHLKQTHEAIKIMKEVLDEFEEGTIIITETNVPHKDNVSYFGNGHDEAGLVYQFPLPPLVMFSFLTGNAEKLSAWAGGLKLPGKDAAFFNFLASHDGIGVRPTEGILTDEERNILVEATLKHGGRVSYKDNGDGTKSPYELNINYQDALSAPDEFDEIRRKRFLAAQTLLLSMQGVPGIYIHSLIGSRNDYYGVETSGMNRRINREKLDYEKLEEELEKESSRKIIFEEYLRRISIRKNEPAFSPAAKQEVIQTDKRVFSLLRTNEEKNEQIMVLINVSGENFPLLIQGLSGRDLLTGEQIDDKVNMEGLMARWIKVEHIK